MSNQDDEIQLESEIESDSDLEMGAEDIIGLMEDLKSQIAAVNYGKALEVLAEAQETINAMHAYTTGKIE
jgi:hypothetical protein